MSTSLLVVQILNGLQLGVLLFLIAAGLTLVFGIMDFINLAHGVQYMLGAYFAVAFYALTGSFLAALVLALADTLAFGLLLELIVFRHLYDRDHLDHVIATFGIILFLNHGVKLVWGAAPLSLPMPELFSGSVQLTDGLLYPVWRLVVIASGLAIATLLYVLVAHTRTGMLVRAGATNAAMVSALGVNIRRLFTIIFGLGAMLAGFAGILIAPILSVEPGMGDTVLILAFVIVVLGGIGSIRGAFMAALVIGLVDTLGRSFSLDLLIGYGGLISFGHAAFVGLGAYAVGILSAHGVHDVVIALPVALLSSALFAYVTGVVCLRTKGVYFIMITLAFGQMVFFTASSLAPYGGDDGLTIAARNTLGGFAFFRSEGSLYYLIWGCLLG